MTAAIIPNNYRNYRPEPRRGVVHAVRELAVVAGVVVASYALSHMCVEAVYAVTTDHHDQGTRVSVPWGPTRVLTLSEPELTERLAPMREDLGMRAITQGTPSR